MEGRHPWRSGRRLSIHCRLSSKYPIRSSGMRMAPGEWMNERYSTRARSGSSTRRNSWKEPFTLLLIHHVVLQMPQLELRRQRDERLAVTKKQIAAFDEAVVEVRHDHALGGVVEVDDDVAAEDEVEVGEERGAGIVGEGEAAELPPGGGV